MWEITKQKEQEEKFFLLLIFAILHEHAQNDGNKYCGDVVGGFQLGDAKHIQRQRDDEQAAYAGHFRNGIIAEEGLNPLGAEDDDALIYKYGCGGEENSRAESGGEDDGGDAVQHGLGVYHLVVAGETALDGC